MDRAAQIEALWKRVLADPAWKQFFALHGVDDGTAFPAPIQVRRDVVGCEDFMRSAGSDSLVVAGDPAASFLYHCLANPAVYLGPGATYPSLDELQLVEDFIFALGTVTANDMQRLVPAVMCYEYREAAATAHQKHADIVYSRAGVARIGNAPARYEGRYRTFVLEAEAAHEVRCLPARYGLFLCEPVKGRDYKGNYLGRPQAEDAGRIFLVPRIKVVEGQTLAGDMVQKVEFGSFHASDRIKRLFAVGGLDAVGDPALGHPPFARSSTNGGLGFDNRSFDNGYLVVQKPGPLVQEALISAGNSSGQVRRAGTVVPQKGVGIPPYNENRRYSTLRVGQELLSAGFDYIGSQLSGGAIYRSPRNCPEFINIRHALSDDSTQVEDINLRTIGSVQFQALVNAGNFKAALYLDSICDGYVKGRFNWRDRVYPATPAFSIVTAPDFFPCIKNLDIQKFASNFKEGGPSPLCEGRLQANVHTRDPETGSAVFGDADTMVAAICAAPRGAGDGKRFRHQSYEVATALTDGASNVFAPGWDVTYGRDGLFSRPYYHTAGLGSPFVEDVKLCAAANGMWAAASPDASRTFARKTPTSMPLTDEELGVHQDSPYHAFLDRSSRGWDGEYGPFFCQGADGSWGVNYSDIWRSDYVSNTLRGLLNFAVLRSITRPDMEKRMKALQDAVHALEGKSAKDSSYWLVSFRTTKNVGGEAPSGILPAGHPQLPKLQAFLKEVGGKSGFLFAFSNFGQPVDSPDPKRLFITHDGVKFVAVTSVGAQLMA